MCNVRLVFQVFLINFDMLNVQKTTPIYVSMEANAYTSTSVDKTAKASTYKSIFNVEFGLLAFVAVIGLIGSLYVFNSDLGSQTQKTSYSYIPTPVLVPIQQDIIVVKEVDLLTISITNLDQALYNNLALDLGDGNQIVLSDSKIQYTYKNAGSYSLLLTKVGDNNIIASYDVNVTNK